MQSEAAANFQLQAVFLPGVEARGDAVGPAAQLLQAMLFAVAVTGQQLQREVLRQRAHAGSGHSGAHSQAAGTVIGAHDPLLLQHCDGLCFIECLALQRQQGKTQAQPEAHGSSGCRCRNGRGKYPIIILYIYTVSRRLSASVQPAAHLAFIANYGIIAPFPAPGGRGDPFYCY